MGTGRLRTCAGHERHRRLARPRGATDRRGRHGATVMQRARQRGA
jgi:hypothetical protein